MIFSWQREVWENTFAHGAPAAALLLAARPGTGEDQFSAHLVQSLLCASQDRDGNGCGVCDSCKAFASGTHPNFRELAPQSLTQAEGVDDASEHTGDATKSKRPSTQIRVDDVRALDELLHFTSHGDGARVIWIHPAESMNVAAANALLKVLEEPPAKTYFILSTVQPARLLPTIVSRCLRVQLPRPSAEQALKELAQTATPKPSVALALSGGSPGLAQRLDEHHWQLRELLLTSLRPRGRGESGTLPNTRIEDTDLPQLLRLLQTWCWDVLAFKLASQVRYHVDERPAIARAAEQIGLNDLVDYEQVLRGARRLVDHPLNARLFFEALLIRYFEISATH